MKIIFLGDSTLQFNDESTYPQVGWPQSIYDLFNDDVKILNFAVNGRSTKSFIELGNFAKAIETVDNDSIMIIEFGHNDEHDYDPERYTRPDFEYRDNLLYMLKEVRGRGGYAILITPVYRRWFNEDGTLRDDCHAGYREAMLNVAEDTGTYVIDMSMLTKKMIADAGLEGSREFFMNFDKGIYPNYPDGMNDNTHLRMKGARAIGELFHNQVKDKEEFKGYFK